MGSDIWVTAGWVYLWHGIPVRQRAACLGGSKMWEKYIILHWKHFKRTRANRVIKLLSPDVLPRAIKIGGLNIYFLISRMLPSQSQQQNTWFNVSTDKFSCWGSRGGGHTDVSVSLPLHFQQNEQPTCRTLFAICVLWRASKTLKETHLKCSPCYKACSQRSHPATPEKSVKTEMGWCKSKSEGWILRVLQLQKVPHPTECNI